MQSKRVIIIGNDVGEEEAQMLMESGFVVVRVDSTEAFVNASGDNGERAPEFHNQIQQELRESEERFRGIFEQGRIGIAVTELDGHFMAINPAFQNITGYSAEELRSLTFLDITYPEDIDPQVALVRELASGRGNGAEIEKRYIRKDGKVIWARLNASAMYSADGKPTFSIEMVEDITERRRLEEEQRRLNRTLKALSRSSQAMMRAVKESDYLDEVCTIIVEDCGHAMVWIGFAEEDEAKSVRPVASAGFEEGYLDALNVTWADTERGRGPTGTAIRMGQRVGCTNMLTDPRFEPWRGEALKRGYMSSLALPLMAEGKAIGAITIYSREPDGFLEDEKALLTELAEDLAHGITAIRLRVARERAEHELALARAEAERRAAEMRSFMENVEEGMSLVDADGKVVWMNRAGRQLFETAEDANLVDWATQFRRLDLDGKPIPLEKSVAYRSLRGETVRDFRYKAITPDGKEIFLSATGSPLRDKEGRIIGATHVFRDIGEELEIDRQRSELYEREHHIAEVLQSAIVPPSVPNEMYGCRIAAIYQSALQEAQVGGDFYDVFDIGEAKIGILIGDVAGKGLAAAIRVAAARYAIRAYAYLDPDRRES